MIFGYKLRLVISVSRRFPDVASQTRHNSLQLVSVELCRVTTIFHLDSPRGNTTPDPNSPNPNFNRDFNGYDIHCLLFCFLFRPY